MWESVKGSERDSWREAGDMQLQTSQNVTAINTPQQLLSNQQCVCTSGSVGKMMASGFSHLKSSVSAPVLLLSCISVDVFSWGDRGMAIPTMSIHWPYTRLSGWTDLNVRHRVWRGAKSSGGTSDSGCRRHWTIRHQRGQTLERLMSSREDVNHFYTQSEKWRLFSGSRRNVLPRFI